MTRDTEAAHAIRFLLTRIGSWTDARWDQHLRNEVGDARAQQAIDWIESHFQVKEYGSQLARATFHCTHGRKASESCYTDSCWRHGLTPRDYGLTPREEGRVVPGTVDQPHQPSCPVIMGEASESFCTCLPTSVEDAYLNGLRDGRAACVARLSREDDRSVMLGVVIEWLGTIPLPQRVSDAQSDPDRKLLRTYKRELKRKARQLAEAQSTIGGLRDGLRALMYAARRGSLADVAAHASNMVNIPHDKAAFAIGWRKCIDSLESRVRGDARRRKVEHDQNVLSLIDWVRRLGPREAQCTQEARPVDPTTRDAIIRTWLRQAIEAHEDGCDTGSYMPSDEASRHRKWCRSAETLLEAMTEDDARTANSPPEEKKT